MNNSLAKETNHKDSDTENFVISTEEISEKRKLGINKISGEENKYISPYVKSTEEQKKEKIASTLVLDSLYENKTSGYSVATTFSAPFLKRHVIKLVADVKSHLTQWVELFKTPEELLHIRSIYEILEKRAFYFDSQPNTRIFLGNIQNFFLFWKKVELKQIQQFSRALDRFESGDIDESSLKNFSQEIFIIQGVIKNAKSQKKE